MTDYAGGKFGGMTFPLSGSATTPDAFLAAADPTLYRTLSFLSAMISTHIGTRLVAEFAAAGITIASSVAMAIPCDPQPFLTDAQIKFPLLAVHRAAAKFDQKTTHYLREVCEWQVHYVFPVVSTLAQYRRLSPALPAVAKILCDRIEQGADPSYTPTGGTLGQSVWQLAGIDHIESVSYKIGAWQATEGSLYFPAMSLTLKVAERSQLLPADFEALGAAQMNVDVHDATTDTDVSDVAIIRTDTT